MKMKLLGKILFTVATLAAVQGAGAAVLVGIYDFAGRKSPAANPELANELTPGMLGWIESPIQASTGSGGDTGGIYGNLGGPTAVAPTYLGDGFATVRVYSPNPSNADLTPGGSSMIKFFVKNTTASAILLPYLFFDAAATTGQFNRFLQVNMVTGAGTTSLTGSPYGPLSPTSPTNFSDYDIQINYLLGVNETVSFAFSAAPGSAFGTTLWVDNMADGPLVPEPSVLALGSLAAGLCFRRRRI